MLIIGFALHNATEGFGIVGPLGGVRPSWRWLGLAGLVGGGPTFLGAMVGYQVTSDALELCFFALAGGAILYVIGEIWGGVRRLGHAELGLYMLGVGLPAGHRDRPRRRLRRRLTPARFAPVRRGLTSPGSIAPAGVPAMHRLPMPRLSRYHVRPCEPTCSEDTWTDCCWPCWPTRPGTAMSSASG